MLPLCNWQNTVLLISYIRLLRRCPGDTRSWALKKTTQRGLTGTTFWSKLFLAARGNSMPFSCVSSWVSSSPAAAIPAHNDDLLSALRKTRQRMVAAHPPGPAKCPGVHPIPVWEKGQRLDGNCAVIVVMEYALYLFIIFIDSVQAVLLDRQDSASAVWWSISVYCSMSNSIFTRQNLQIFKWP